MESLTARVEPVHGEVNGPGRFPLGRLSILTGATFASNTSEFLPAGVLPEMAADLGVSESQIGFLVAVFALTVAVSTLPLTALTRPLSRKPLLVALLVGLALTNFACALAPAYGAVLAARIFGGLCHGLFWSVATPYASYLVAREQRARALTVVNAGTTIAFFLGVPIGTAIGVALGWRAAFALAGAIMLVIAVIAMLLLPPVRQSGEGNAKQTTSVLRDKTLPALLAVGGIVVLAALGQFSFFTYIAPWLRGPAGIPAELVSPMLLIFGLAGAAGLAGAGFAGDRNLDLTLIASMGATAGSVVLLYYFAHGPLVVALLIAVWGASFAGFPSLVQAMALDTASTRIHDFAGAIIAVSFNAATFLGALIGGGVIDFLDVSALPWSQFIFSVAALTLACFVVARRRSLDADLT